MKLINPKRDLTLKMYRVMSEIADILATYFESYIEELKQKYNSELGCGITIEFDEAEIEQLKKLGFDKLIETLNEGKVTVRIVNSKTSWMDIFVIKSFNKEAKHHFKYELNKELARDFVSKNQSAEMLDERCQFWLNVIKNVFEQEEKYVSQLKNKFTQSNVYKSVCALKEEV